MMKNANCNPNEGSVILDEPPAAKLANHDPSEINDPPDPDSVLDPYTYPAPGTDLDPDPDPDPGPPVAVVEVVVGESIEAF